MTGVWTVWGSQEKDLWSLLSNAFRMFRWEEILVRYLQCVVLAEYATQECDVCMQCPNFITINNINAKSFVLLNILKNLFPKKLSCFDQNEEEAALPIL